MRFIRKPSRRILYIREQSCTDKEQRLRLLEQDLIAALKRPKVDLDMTEVRKKGLLAVLRAQDQLALSHRRYNSPGAFHDRTTSR
jgi:hypothetical protein